MTDATEHTPAAQTARRSRVSEFIASDFFYMFRRSPVAIVSFMVVMVLVLSAVFAPLIAPYDPFNPASLNPFIRFKLAAPSVHAD